MHDNKFTLGSSAFDSSRAIPSRYANTGVLGGKNISIPLKWEHVPEGTKSFAVSIVDLHPVANHWIHWLVINIPGTTDSLQEGASTTNKMPSGSKELQNSFRSPGYGGPQPPKGSGPHKYEVTVYALNVGSLDLDMHIPLSKFIKTLEGKVIAAAKTIGMFERM